MLTISKAISAGQAQSYHKQEYTSDSQTYYKDGDTVKGEWQGQLAASFKLSGEVAPLEFSRLSEGKHPQTEAQMVKHRPGNEYTNADGTTTREVEHRAGWDATFSAPKSVSLTALVGGDERVKEAHRNAVTTALTELERYTQARIGGNNPAETTAKFIAAKFEHDTARPVDGYAAPQLHTHAVIFNVTERADGSTRALQPQSLFDSQNFATAVYQSALTHELHRLGYELERGKSGAPEIKGYTAEYLEASSPRSQQIKKQLEKTGHSGPEAAQIAAHTTRDSKQHFTAEQVLSAHKAMAQEFGNQPEQVVAAAHKRAREGKGQEPDGTRAAKEAVTYARDSIFEREAVADERLILRDALRRGMGETTYAQVRAEFDSRQKQGDFLTRESQKHDTGRSFTTLETIAHERANVRHVLEGRNAVEPMMSAEDAKALTTKALAKPDAKLNERQQAVVEEVLNTADRIHGLQGLAGSGKTTALKLVREGAEQNGYTVQGFAPSSKAAGALRDAGVEAKTLQSFLASKQPDPEARHLYMLDESSLASSKQMRGFLEKIGPNDRVLVIGDVRQHQAVDAGRPFQQMQDGGMRTSQLDQIVRQRDPELLQAVQQLATGNVENGIKMLADQKRITEVGNPQERISAIAKDYAADPAKTLIVSPDNRSRQQINEAVRAELLSKGALAEDGKQFKTLTHRNDMTGADRTWAARYEVGDVLQYTKGSKSQGLERDSFATVRSVDARANTITVERADGQTVTYDPNRLRGVNAYKETAREFSTGDRIQFTAHNKDLKVANRDLGTITGIEPGKMTMRLDGKTERTITFDPDKVRGLDHGYAVTSHSSQGLTERRVIVNIDTEASRNLINSRLAYVAISRAELDARIYTNDAANLGQKLAADISKTAAVNFRPKLQTEETREAVKDLKEKPQAAVKEVLKEQRRSHEYAHPEHRLTAVSMDYAARPDRAVVIAPDPGERRELTQLIRADLYAQGRLIGESRAVPVLVERELANAKLAAQYTPGDQIHYKTGSPEKHGIARDSTATVVTTDGKRNVLTVDPGNGEPIAYRPHELKGVTANSTVYRQETRELAVGERIQLTRADKSQGIRSGDFATVERIADSNALTVRLHNGKTAELDPEKAKHIEYGYAVDGSKRVQADRVLATGESLDAKAVASVSGRVRDLSVYTSDGSSLQKQKQEQTPIPKEVAIPEIPQPQRQYHGFGLSR